LPYEVTIDHDTRTIAIRGYGSGTTAETLQLIADQQDTFRRCAGYNFLYDSSALEIESSPADMMKVADALFAEAGAHFRRFAIVVPDGRLSLARMFTALADPHGVDANVFVYLDDARRWLGILHD
jgi:hypothetical protein